RSVLRCARQRLFPARRPLSDAEEHTEKGAVVEPAKGFRPVAINIGVKDLEEAIRFYEEVFGTKFEVDESEGRPVHARLRFGEGDSFFLFNMRKRGTDDPHRDHTSAFGFVVDDLEAAHRRAVAAGAREHFEPVDQEGLPRHSRFEDPSGNRIVLWQR
ncbi:MAG: VOC family protein, partial [Actinobacteria bacterium]|nr:VOC family protein [Actinomycetota bacterium]